MKKISLFAAIMAGLLAVGCMQKEEIAPAQMGENKIHLTVRADYPQQSPDTKVAFGEGENPGLTWTGNETMAVLVGTPEVTTSKTAGLQLTLGSVAPGVFSGELNLGEFTTADIQGIVVPAENGAFYTWNSDKSRVFMPLAAEQTQEKNGEFNPEYVPFVAQFTVDSLGTPNADGSYTVDGIQLLSGTDLVQFNVYGKHPLMESGEILKSVKITTNNRIVGEVRWDVGSTGTPGSNSNGAQYVVANLTEQHTVADKTQADGIKLYASVVLGGNRTFSLIEVVTDKSVYMKRIDKTIPMSVMTTLKVHRIGVDLSNGYTRIVETPMYSIDGGNNWVEEMPDSFSRLAVKNEIDTTVLVAIKTKIAAQSTPVDLDLSASEYESVDFPTTFAGTKETPNTSLKSISFPLNVTNISEKAFFYCSALESVNLDGISKICAGAFRYSGLKSVRVENTVKTLEGTYHFGDCFQLTEAYFNVPRSGIPSGDPSCFRWSTRGLEKTADFTLTIGHDSTFPRYCTADNTNLVKLVFEYTGETDLTIGNNALNRAYYLQTVVCHGTTGQMLQGQAPTISTKVEGDKYLVVPDGCADKYKNHTSANSFYNKFCVANSFTLIEQSAYDAL